MLLYLFVQCLLDVRMSVPKIIYTNSRDKVHIPFSIRSMDVNSFGALNLKSKRKKSGLRET